MAPTLSPSLVARIQRIAADRGYADAEDLLAEALDKLEGDEDDREDIRALIEEADAEGETLSLDEVRAHLDKTFKDIRVKLGL